MTRTLPAPSQPHADTDAKPRHFKRVMRFTRPSDWAYGAVLGATSPALLLYWEKVSPSFVGKGGFAPIMRLTGAIGVSGAFLFAYTRSSSTPTPCSIYADAHSHASLLLTVYNSALLRRPREPP